MISTGEYTACVASNTGPMVHCAATVPKTGLCNGESFALSVDIANSADVAVESIAFAVRRYVVRWHSAVVRQPVLPRIVRYATIMRQSYAIDVRSKGMHADDLRREHSLHIVISLLLFYLSTYFFLFFSPPTIVSPLLLTTRIEFLPMHIYQLCYPVHPYFGDVVAASSLVIDHSHVVIDIDANSSNSNNHR